MALWSLFNHQTETILTLATRGDLTAISLGQWPPLTTARLLIAPLGHALLVVAWGAVVGINDGVGGSAVGAAGLSQRVDAVDIVEHGGNKEGEHGSAVCSTPC